MVTELDRLFRIRKSTELVRGLLEVNGIIGGGLDNKRARVY